VASAGTARLSRIALRMLHFRIRRRRRASPVRIFRYHATAPPTPVPRAARIPHHITRTTLLLAVACVLGACPLAIGPAPTASRLPTEQQVFWTRLKALCGNAYAGRMVEGTDSVYLANPPRIGVGGCAADTVRIGFHIAADTSRQWIVSRGGGGLRLRHVARDEAGHEERVSGYGGVTAHRGSVTRQDFAADSFTARLLPPAAQNVCTLEIESGRALAYTVWRPGTTRRFRLVFDLRRPLPPPAAAETPAPAAP
jgi:hypothetical protein